MTSPDSSTAADGHTPGVTDTEGHDGGEQVTAGASSPTAAAVATLSTARRSGYGAGEGRRRAQRERFATVSGDSRSIPVHTPGGGTDGSVELPAEIFDAPVSTALLHQVVTAQLAAARQGTHSTLTRGETRGGSKKPYRQKGTGRARQGSTRAPQFTGGGTVHGPKPRSYDQRTPKKMKVAALRGALSDRARHDRIHVFSGLADGATPSTKGARTALEGVVAPARDRRRVLAVIGRDEEASRRSVDNLPTVHPITPDQLNTYDVLRADDVVFTSAALEAFVAARTASQEADQ